MIWKMKEEKRQEGIWEHAKCAANNSQKLTCFGKKKVKMKIFIYAVKYVMSNSVASLLAMIRKSSLNKRLRSSLQDIGG